MKLSKNTMSSLVTLVLLGSLIGTFAWELVEQLLSFAGWDLRLRLGPLGFDARVIAVTVIVNPGTLLGVAFGIRSFRAV